MPRLAGKQSNTGLYVFLAIVLVLAAFLLLEYFGTIDLINNFGR